MIYEVSETKFNPMADCNNLLTNTLVKFIQLFLNVISQLHKKLFWKFTTLYVDMRSFRASNNTLHVKW